MYSCSKLSSRVCVHGMHDRIEYSSKLLLSVGGMRDSLAAALSKIQARNRKSLCKPVQRPQPPKAAEADNEEKAAEADNEEEGGPADAYSGAEESDDEGGGNNGVCSEVFVPTPNPIQQAGEAKAEYDERCAKVYEAACRTHGRFDALKVLGEWAAHGRTIPSCIPGWLDMKKYKEAVEKILNERVDIFDNSTFA